MGQGSKSVILLKALVRGEVQYLSKFKLTLLLITILFGVLSIYDPYISNLNIILLGKSKYGYYVLVQNNSTGMLYTCNVTPITYFEDNNSMILGLSLEKCLNYFNVVVCNSCAISSKQIYLVPSSNTLNNYLKLSINGVVKFIETMIVVVTAVGIFMLSYETVVSSNRLIEKLRFWNINTRTAFIVWSLISMLIIVFIGMCIGVVIATLASFTASLTLSAIYIKPVINIIDIAMVFASLMLSSILGTIIGLKGIEKCSI